MERIAEEEKAWTFYKAEDYRSAKAVLAPIVASEPDAAFAIGVNALCDYKLGSKELALREAVSAMSADPEDGWACSAYGTLLSWEGRHAEAAEYFSRATELEPESAGFLVAYGECLLELGRPAKALILAERALGFDPENVRAQRLEQSAAYSTNFANLREAAARHRVYGAISKERPPISALEAIAHGTSTLYVVWFGVRVILVQAFAACCAFVLGLVGRNLIAGPLPPIEAVAGLTAVALVLAQLFWLSMRGIQMIRWRMASARAVLSGFLGTFFLDVGAAAGGGRLLLPGAVCFLLSALAWAGHIGYVNGGPNRKK